MIITLGDQTFPSKKAADCFLKLILDHGNGYVVTQEEFAVLDDLLSRHPEAETKRGCGVSTYFVDRAPKYHWQSCFHLMRTDGTCTDFSRHSCLKPDNARTAVLRALRDAVDEDILVAKKRKFEELGGKVRCPLTGLDLGWKDCHADHKQPQTFEMLGSAFVTALGMSFEEFKRLHIVHSDNSIPHLVDGMRIQFSTYHRSLANIHLICGLRNCSQAHEFRMNRTSDGYVSLAGL
jgi:hypothetical protein